MSGVRPVVECRNGKLRGTWIRGVATFLGIPFARPPVGELRFRAPAPAEPWAGVREAVETGPSAPQPTGSGGTPIRLINGFLQKRIAEDCLYLNVWTPNPGDEGRRPVMVWSTVAPS